jgi:hypothetical protein
VPLVFDQSNTSRIPVVFDEKTIVSMVILITEH